LLADPNRFMELLRQGMTLREVIASKQSEGPLRHLGTYASFTVEERVQIKPVVEHNSK
jgi:hypothetical protein